MENNLNDATGKNFEKVDPAPAIPALGNPEVMNDAQLIDAVKQTTGIDFSSEMVYRSPEEAAYGSTPANYEEMDAAEDVPPTPPTPVNTPKPITVNDSMSDDVVQSNIPGVGAMLSAEDAAKLGITGDGVKIDPEDAYKENVEKKVKQIRDAERQGYEAMESAAVQAEQERMDRLEATLALPDDHPDKIKLVGDRKAMSQPAQLTAKERREMDRIMEGVNGYDPSELVPGYTMDDAEITEETPKAEEKKDPVPEDDDYGEFIRSLPVSEFTPTQTPVIVTKRQPTINEITDDWTRKKNRQPLGDQAFTNAVAKFKRNHFGVKMVPLVNSGFFVDVVGTGVVDLQNLYMNVDPNTQMYEYQMEQMRVMIQNIVGATPRIDPNTLRDKIHFADAQMIAYGHICATLEKAESVTNCTECGMAFRTNGKPDELLMNMDKLAEKMELIRNASSIEENSLLNRYREITSVNGIIITLGHPSYANELGILNSFAAYYNHMTPQEANRFNSLLRTMYMIRKITLPNGVQTNSLYQIYEALKLISQEDLEMVQREVTKMYDEIIYPQFGIREVVCPHCGKIVKDVAYNDMLNMLFMHTQLSGYLNEPTDQR